MEKILKGKNLFFLFNIFIILIIFFFIKLLQKNSVMIMHDIFMPFEFNIFNSYGRIPGQVIGYLLNNFLPDLFNLHPNDYRAGLGSTIFTVIYIILLFVFSYCFFLGNYKEKSIFSYFETGFLLIFSSLLFCLPIGLSFVKNSYPLVFSQFREYTVVSEYTLGLIPFFLFIFLLYKVFINNFKLDKKQVYLYSFIFFLTSFWNEFLMLTSLFVLTFLLLLYKKKTINIFKENYLIFISYFAGIFVFILFSDFFSGNTIASYEYSFIDSFKNIFIYFKLFIKSFSYFVIFDKLIYFILIFLFSFLVLKFDKEKGKEIVFFNFSILFGVLTTLFSSILFINLTSEFFLFLKTSFVILYTDILIAICLIILGRVYFYKPNIVKKISFIILFIVLNTAYAAYGYLNYNKYISYFQKIKVQAYRIEELTILYTIKDKIIKYPVSYALENHFFNRRGNIHFASEENKVSNYENFYVAIYKKYYNNEEDEFRYIFRSDKEVFKEYAAMLKEFGYDYVTDFYILYSKNPFTEMRNKYINELTKRESTYD